MPAGTRRLTSLVDFQLNRRGRWLQGVFSLAALGGLLVTAAQADVKPAAEAKVVDANKNPKAVLVTKAEDMQPYKYTVPHTNITFEMVPVTGGEFLMGSPADEPGRKANEGPQVKVKVSPYWIGKYEITWDEYEVWNLDLDVLRRTKLNLAGTDRDAASDAVTRPTKPYTDMTFDSGHDGYPATGMTPIAAMVYCQWLSAKSGHYYRLPTEAEWEFAARGGTKTAYSFGDDPKKLGDYAWFKENVSEDREVNYYRVGQKKPNPFGLYDMHGNVAEYCVDDYDEDYLKRLKKMADANGGVVVDPVNPPKTGELRTVRGGSWNKHWFGNAEELRSAARENSVPDDWKVQDPQEPQSVWYYTDGTHVGFRIVRPLHVPSLEDQKKKGFTPVIPEQARILQRVPEE